MLRTTRAVWAQRDEDAADDGVWSVTCFVVRRGWRRRGVGHALAAATPEHARSRGARAIEGYPRLPGADGRSVGDAFYVGTVGAFAAAGFVEVARPTDRRAVYRIDF